MIVGTGKGGRIGVFKNKGGHLTPAPNKVPWRRPIYTTVLGLAENGTVQLVAGVSTWEARTIPEMKAQPAAVSVAVSHGDLASVAKPVVGSHESATGPMALADYDGDGELDLFVGSRAIPMRYPVPASSGLFHERRRRKVRARTREHRRAARRRPRVVGGVRRHQRRRTSRSGARARMGIDRAAPQRRTRALHARAGVVGTRQVDESMERHRRRRPGRRRTARHRRDELGTKHADAGGQRAAAVAVSRPDRRGAAKRRCCSRARIRAFDAIAPLNSYARVRVAMPDIVSRLPTFAAYADATVDKVLGPRDEPRGRD